MEITKSQADPNSAKSRYQKWLNLRQPFLDRAYACSRLTIPSLVPWKSEQTTRRQDPQLEDPWQSIGSSGLNTLAAKTLTALFPSNTPYFRFLMGRAEREELLQLDGPEADEYRARIDQGLQAMEQDVQRDFEKIGYRTTLYQAFRHLYVSGNVLLYLGDKPKYFPLFKYVVRRDGEGDTKTVIVKELMDRSSLPDGFYEAYKDDSSSLAEQEDVEVFTIIERRNARWTVYQEALDQEIPGTRGTYTDKSCPWVPMRLTKLDGEDYGRGYIDELFGDLSLAEDLSKAIAQGSLIAAKTIWAVNPNGMTDEDDLQNAFNGDVISGRAEDVRAIQAEKYADLRTAEVTLEKVTARLERAFLMTSSVQRAGERVTAYEIAEMAAEIDDALGGLYSMVSETLQLRLVELRVHKMTARGDLPKIANGSIEPSVVTGLEALGRGQELSKLRGWVQDMTALVQAKLINPAKIDGGELITRISNGHMVDTTGLIVSDEELAKQQQQQQQQAMMQEAMSKGIGPAINAGAQAARSE